MLRSPSSVSPPAGTPGPPRVRVLPAERRLYPGPAQLASACCTTCCCCSCCLHTVGGLVGAARGSRAALRDLGETARPAINAYWISLLVLLALSGFGGAQWFWIVVLGLLPLVQLLASLVGLLITRLFSPHAPLDAFRPITQKGLLGALIGLLLLLPLTLFVLR